MEIFLRGEHRELARRPGRARGELQQHRAQDDPHEAERRYREERERGLDHSLRVGLRRAAAAEIPGRGHRARYRVQERFRERIQGKLSGGDIRSHEGGEGGPQRLRAERPGRRGADIREILRGGVVCRQQERGRRIQGRENTEKAERDGAGKVARLRRQGGGEPELGSSERHSGAFGFQRIKMGFKDLPKEFFGNHYERAKRNYELATAREKVNFQQKYPYANVEDFLFDADIARNGDVVGTAVKYRKDRSLPDIAGYIFRKKL